MVEELQSDTIPEQHPAAEAKMFLSASVRGRLAFVKNERERAQFYADACVVVAAAKTAETGEQSVCLSKMKVAKLSKLCAFYDLPTNGKKPDLLQRLHKHDGATTPGHSLRTMIEIDDAFVTVSQKWSSRLTMPVLDRHLANSELNVLLSEQVIEQFTFITCSTT